MKTTGHIDWLSVTFAGTIHKTEYYPRQSLLGDLHLAGAGPHGYREKWTNDLGVVVLTAGTVAQGVHVDLTGEPLEALRQEGVTDGDLARFVTDREGKPSRLDVTVNLLGASVTIGDLKDAYERGAVRSKARGGLHWKNLDTPEETLYLGSRQSNRYFRGYNKGAQVQSTEAWIRLELQTRKLVARAILTTLATVADTRAVINRAILDYVEFLDVSEIQQALAEHDAIIPRVPRKRTNTLTWLLDVCAPALARYALDHPDKAVEDDFRQAYQQAIRRLAREKYGSDIDPETE